MILLVGLGFFLLKRRRRSDRRGLLSRAYWVLIALPAAHTIPHPLVIPADFKVPVPPVVQQPEESTIAPSTFAPSGAHQTGFGIQDAKFPAVDTRTDPAVLEEVEGRLRRLESQLLLQSERQHNNDSPPPY